MYIISENQLWLYDINKKEWSRLPDCVYYCTSLQILNGLPTTIGGSPPVGVQPVNKLMSLTEEGHGRVWREIFPPMSAKRNFATSVCTRAVLIVVGGYNGEEALTTVEILKIENHQWSIAADLPEPLWYHSATVCGDQLYMLGGASRYIPTKSVYTCSVSTLLQTCNTQTSLIGTLKRALTLSNSSSSGDRGVWSQVAELPVTDSTCVTFCGQLLAICGEDSDSKPTTAVYMYNPSTNSWNVISHMTTARSRPFAAVLPDNQLMVVGGMTKINKWASLHSVQFGSLI